jgi:hypothetical protein
MRPLQSMSKRDDAPARCRWQTGAFEDVKGVLVVALLRALLLGHARALGTRHIPGSPS